jgi:hypothetical protein
LMPNHLHPVRIFAALALSACLYGASKIPCPIPWRMRFGLLAFLIFLTAAIVASGLSVRAYQVVWSSVILLIPITVLAGSILLWKGRKAGISSLRQQQVFMLLSIVGICSLIQFPFSAPTYFCYVAPLVVLAICAVIASLKRQSPFIYGSLLVFYIVFAVLYATPGFIYKLGAAADSDKQIFCLDLPPHSRVLKVSRESAQEYQTLIPLVQRHARSQYIYAAPDCPEVYFLSGLRNPTRTIFEFLDEPARSTEQIINKIVAYDLNEVVLFQKPEFSPPIPLDLKQKLELRFPNWVNVGRFQVRWRD